MHINNAGVDFCHPSDFEIYRRNGTEDNMLLILKSRAEFVIGGKSMVLQKNTVILYRRCIPQIYRAAGEPFKNDWIHFDADDGDMEYIKSLGIPFETPVVCEDTSVLSAIVKHIYLEKFSANTHKAQSLTLYFRLLMLKIGECMESGVDKPSQPHYDKLSKLRADIYSEPQNERTVKGIAESLALSPSYMQHLYKRIFGVGISADIITARIERAKYLLSGTSYTVSAVSSLCGYNNDVHFMRQFKETVGITPSEYRRRYCISEGDVAEAMKKHPGSHI